MQYDVFISYSSLDKNVADAICSKLENNGIRCWIAPRDILPGKEYGEAIIGAIVDCNIMLLVFSVHANESPQVRREVERAVSKGKVIIPFRIEDILPTKAMEYALSNTHWLDAMTPPLENHIARLIDIIYKLLNMEDSTIVTPPQQPKPVSALSQSLAGLKIIDSSGYEFKLVEFGIVYNLFAEKVLANSIRNYLIVEKGNAVQEIPWTQIEKLEIKTLEDAKIKLIDSKILVPTKLQSGRLVGKDDFGFAVVLDLVNIRTIFALKGKIAEFASGGLSGFKSQLTWKMKTTAGPGKRSSFGMVYDDDAERVILHGGYGSGVDDDRPFASIIFRSPDLSDTWIWNGSTWKSLNNRSLTIQRYAMAYNKQTKQNLIYGGWTGSQRLGETYLMSDDEWIQLNHNNDLGPGVRDELAMVYDEKRESIILFGGSNMKLEFGQFTKANQVAFADTWEFKDSIWEKLHVKGPEARWGHKMVFDESNGVGVLFGGYNGAVFFNDTWIWEGNTARWEKIIAVNSPSARYSHAMAYDSAAKKIFLFGGKTDSNVALNDLWEWDGNDWKLLMEQTPPKPRYDHGLVYDVKRNKTILYGGFDGKEWFEDTWELTF